MMTTTDLNKDCRQLILDFGRDLTVSEIFGFIMESLEEFSRQQYASARGMSASNYHQMKWFLTFWTPACKELPIRHPRLTEINENEKQNFVTALKWLKWSA